MVFSVEGWLEAYGYPGLFVLLMLGIVGLPVPDETLLAFAGYLVFKRTLGLPATLLAAFLGTTCGITLSYGLGRGLGPGAVRRFGHRLRVTPEHLDRVQAWYRRHGRYALFLGYFVPGVRHLVAFVAGSARLPLPLFALFAYTGGLVWSLTFILLGYGFGEEWARMSAALHRILLILAGVVAAGLLVAGLVLRRRVPAP
jgi:membrane protein DedA with SNARE-associated domain